MMAMALFLVLKRVYLNKMYYLKVWLLRLVFPHQKSAMRSVVDDLLYKHYALEYLVKGGAGISSSPESVVDDDWMDDILDFVPPSDIKMKKSQKAQVIY